MNKELLEIIDSMIERIAEIELHTGKSENVLIDKSTLLDIQKELELQAIDNPNISEAMKCVDRLNQTINLAENFYDSVYEDKDMFTAVQRDVDTIKQALIKSQKKTDKEIAFDLIDTKNVDIKLLKWAYPNVEAYNVKVREQKDYWWREELTKEEFDFLGKMIGAK